MKLYKDKVHGLIAAAGSKIIAWQLIRNECHNRKIEVPTMDKIVLITKNLKSNGSKI